MDRYLGGDTNQLSGGKVLFNALAINKTKVDLIKAWQQDMLQP